MAMKPTNTPSSGSKPSISGQNQSGAPQRTYGYASSRHTDFVSELNNFALEEEALDGF